MFISKIRKSISNMLRVDSIISKNLIISSLKEHTFNSRQLGIDFNNELDKPIVVSLTTYGKKIFDVYLVIESIFQQTIKPDKVVLWLSEDNFSINTIPVTLKRQIDRGLMVRFCKDLRSYTKLVYALGEYRDSHIISIDDDIIYPFDMIENFILAYRKDPGKIYFNKGHKMLFDGKNKIMQPYIDWCYEGYANGSSILNLPLGVYGVFYPSGLLYEDVTKHEIFLEISPTADDIWFKAMSLINGIECQSIMKGALHQNDFVSIELDREIALARINVDQSANDWQIQKVFEKYSLFDKIDEKICCKSIDWQ